MITLKLQLILLVVTIIIFLTIINMVLKYKLELKYALLWIILGAIFIIITIFPPIVYTIAEILNIETPANAIFLLGILFLLAIAFSLTIALSRYSNKVKNLSQELGLLKNEVKSIKERFKRNE